jgi:hypothetical protein
MNANEKIQAIRTRVIELQGMGAHGMGDDVPAAGSTPMEAVAPILGLASLAGMGALAYHGYKRNDSVLWAVGWGLLGGAFPVGTVIGGVIAYGQGFGKPISESEKSHAVATA